MIFYYIVCIADADKLNLVKIDNSNSVLGLSQLPLLLQLPQKWLENNHRSFVGLNPWHNL